MRRPSLKTAVGWIAENDEPNEFDENDMSELVSVVMVADLFGVTPEVVAKKVVAYRYKRDGHSCETCGAYCGYREHVTCEACRMQSD